ncbi:RDD family protein [Auraticoccus monumenti]|uniref:RDD family protein n=1 Tax=Auraticoccus monumenti TaxID=675864 RepID=A0A1G6ZFF8_9ACTN|nr:RDD family protein [Auraticoccus monumenti]SDE00446.1 Protein of unknown function [Auraticoccus monumenti]
MNDIPVGTPKPPPGRHAAPGGWYPDPVDPRRERWWDGWQWSRETREGSGPPPVPQGAHPQQHPAPQPVGRGAPALTADGVPLAGWWARALAITIDGVLLTVITGLLSIPFLGHFMQSLRSYFDVSLDAARRGAPPPPQPDPGTMMTITESLAVSVIALLCGLAWHGLFLRLRGATPGKMVVGLRVVPVDQGRHTGGLGWRPALLRALVWVLPALGAWLFVLRVVDIVLPLTNPRKQALHDLVARTQVVRRR